MKDNWNKLKEFIKQNKQKVIRALVSWTVCIICLFFIMNSVKTQQIAKIEKVEYTEFLDDVENGKVDTVYYSASDEWMTYTLLNDDTKDMTQEEREEYTYKSEDKRRVQYPAYDTFRKDMLEHDVHLVLDRNNTTVVDMFSMMVSLAVPTIWIVIIMRMMKGQMKGVEAKDIIQTSNVKFSDVIGQDEILDDVKFITELLKNRDLGEEIGAKVPKGILLSGEPGTGKTLIAKAIAGEAGVPFIYVNSSSLIEMFVGLGAKRVRETFKIARENAPCIVFFDEIDSIGIKRDTRGSNTENEQTINALLQEMDGFTGRDGVFIIAATNRADKLDSALTRAGRFDRQIVVNKPRDWKVRVKLFEFYLEQFSVASDIDVETLAKQVSGFTGADIAAICNEASIIAVMHKKPFIDMACLEEAIDKKVFKGNRAKEEHFKEDKKIVAYHEAGHAVIHYLLGEPMSRVSIIGTTSGVGGVVFGEDSDTQFLTKEYYENRVKICYAGRASEQIKFNSVTQGASSDITQATGILEEYVSRLGFEEEFGLLDMNVLAERQIIDKSNAFELMQRKSKELYGETVDLLTKNYDLVEKLAKALLEYETLNGKEIEEVLSRVNVGA